MNRLIMFFFLSISASSSVFSQTDSLSIIDCMKSAWNNATHKTHEELVKEIGELKIENLGTSNLPGLSAYGKAWYQSDAIAVVSQVPGGSSLEIDKFQYNLGLEANQKIYDGGMANRNKDFENASINAEIQKIESDRYQINDKVTRSFFTTLLMDKSKEILLLKVDLLTKRSFELNSAVKNGVVIKSELDKLNAEILLTQQQIIDVESKQLQSIYALVKYTGNSIPEGTRFYIPDSVYQITASQRPEYKYFEAEQIKLDKAILQVSGKKLPKLYAYGQLGYTYPGLNFFENKPDYYYIVGAKLSWTLIDWDQTGHDKSILARQQSIVNTQKSEFDRNRDILIENEKLDQEKLSSLIKIDMQIIEQRKSITLSSASALANGVITSSDYIEDLNAEIRARFELENHKIQSQNSIVKEYLLQGIDFDNL